MTDCCHHWLIEPVNGETSKGHCKICGDTRDFFNDADHRDLTATRERAAAGGRKNKGKKRVRV